MQKTIIPVRIGVYDYKILFLSEREINDKYLEQRMSGFIDLVRKEININRDMDLSTQKETIIHEFLHGLFHEWGINLNLDIEKDMEEKIVTTLSKGIYEIETTGMLKAIFELMETGDK
ncbi:ImmA/IrrE family metallo-endopeptidase [Sebaldella termitidis]|nr:ImmA/IrrE family metallo-endopeptidase [Sebaldella termitidis]ACZ09690.1 hypothetical protein Sterm_2846 [Sebaldella termitidis ATCC 33386]